jgi:hypothetical protein
MDRFLSSLLMLIQMLKTLGVKKSFATSVVGLAGLDLIDERNIKVHVCSLLSSRSVLAV